MESFAKHFIMPWGAMLFFVFVIVVVVGVEIGVAAIIKTNTVSVSNVACNVKSIDPNDKTVRVKLDCNGEEVWTENTKFVIGYMKKDQKQAVACDLYVWGDEAVCKLSE